MDQALINRIVEAALMAGSQPLTLAQLHGLFPEENPAPPGSVEQALEQLREACAERGVELVEVASGFRYQVKEEVHGWVARMWTERKTKYTRATLETLALIAYRQPITRGEIEQVRGVAVSSNIIQALEEREWIRVVGHRDVPGKPALFGTTKVFLDYFGLKRLDELPPLSELKDIGELEPQLPLDGAPLPVSIALGDAPTADHTDHHDLQDEQDSQGDEDGSQEAGHSDADGDEPADDEDAAEAIDANAENEDKLAEPSGLELAQEPQDNDNEHTPPQDDDAADSEQDNSVQEHRAPSEQNQ